MIMKKRSKKCKKLKRRQVLTITKRRYFIIVSKMASVFVSKMVLAYNIAKTSLEVLLE